jgi:hypothetical protein
MISRDEGEASALTGVPMKRPAQVGTAIQLRRDVLGWATRRWVGRKLEQVTGKNDLVSWVSLN